MELIRTATGQVLARIQSDAAGDGCTVYSPTGQLLGYCRDGWTRTAGGTIVCQGHRPMALVR